MYPASNAFHAAVANHEPQMAMIMFEDAVFTNEDISVDNGIEMDDYFNLEEDIAIGQTPSNEIRFSLFNDNGYINDYGFGEFLATVGVRIMTTYFTPTGSLYVENGKTGSARTVWDVYGGVVRRNGSPVSGAPGNTNCILIRNDIVYCFGNGSVATFSDSTGSPTYAPVSYFMQKKCEHLDGIGACYRNQTRLLKLYSGNEIQTYEFVPLGYFQADRPNVPTQIQIDFTCYDRMQRFDVDMLENVDVNIAYPTTISGVLQWMCARAGVPCATTEFLNGDIVLTEDLEEYKSATMRTVLGWIAEVAGCNARINRDGELELAWIKYTSQTYNERDYVDFTPYWFMTQSVGELRNRTTENGLDIGIGSGPAYLIQDNPFTKSVNDALRDEEVRKAKENSMEKEARKIQLCIDTNGNINYEKLAWITDDEVTWKQQAKQWDEEHPGVPGPADPTYSKDL